MRTYRILLLLIAPIPVAIGACNDQFGHVCGDGTKLNALNACVAEQTSDVLPEDDGGDPSTPITDAGGAVGACEAGTTLDGSACVPTSPSLSCGAGTQAAGGVCVGTLSCGPGTTEQNGRCVPIVQNEVVGLDGLVAYACTANRCRAEDVVGYWQDRVQAINGTHWDDYATHRRVEFHQDAATDDAPPPLSFNVSDDKGNAWTCSKGAACGGFTFEAGHPVTLTLVNTTAGRHSLSAAPFYRTVAWRRAQTSIATYEAPAFDSFYVSAGATAVIHFVPIVPGEYASYCHVGTKNGESFPEIIAGTVTPTLTTGHAGRGMSAKIVVTDPSTVFANKTVFQGASANRDPALDSDPRRANTWWTAPTASAGKCCTTVPVTLTETSATNLSIATTGARVTATAPLTLNAGLGYQLTVQNVSTTNDHEFTARGLFEKSILRSATDTAVEIRAPYLTGVDLVAGGTSNVYLVPTSIGRFTAYCPKDVNLSQNGSPDLTTGHAGLGMQGPIEVVP